MIVSAFISKVRRNYADLPVKALDVISGDGASTVFKSTKSPILEGSYGLYIDNVLKSPGTDYTIDLDTGDIVLTTATTGVINLKYQSVNKRDEDWLGFIQSGIRGFGDEFYRSIVRVPGPSLSAGITTADMPSSCIFPMEVYGSVTNTSAGPFAPLPINHQYDRRSNKLILGSGPDRLIPTQVSYLSRIQKPQATSATLDLEDNWIEMLELKTGAIYARAMAMEIATQGNVSVEEGHLSTTALRQLALDHENAFQQLKRRNRPVRPNYTIPIYKPGGGDIRIP